MKPRDLLLTARALAANGGRGRPRQSDLRRALSSAYYALFHTMCYNCADSLVDRSGASSSKRAWQQAYRSVEHKFAADQCKNREVLQRFPKEIEDFAQTFRELQQKRHQADYDPFATFTLLDVATSIDQAEVAIQRFRAAAGADRRAFAVWCVLRTR